MKPISFPDEKIHRIWEALKGLQYGTVLITVHDSNIVQIERTEKHRFPSEASSLSKKHASAANKK
ncbi:YezD family protein [Thermoactinomyces daqus]|uniref:YezD family protein n=1 Tax=Thermoactinomyces daqus TaxID=1329516 RepID=A0A7W2AGC2_9BACL|nr:YezD family protein [Thermoactinomyces daqus]MBA4541501.1 YezD family protein [Thermoactinomyces daqus]